MTVVLGPCPVRRSESSGKVNIFSKIPFNNVGISPSGKSVLPMLPENDAAAKANVRSSASIR